MVTGLILVGIITLCAWICSKEYEWSLDGIAIFSLLVAILSSILLIIHIVFFAIKPYTYGEFAARRSSFEQTLGNARINGNQYEIATIVRDIADWNIELASLQYSNSTDFLDQYIDDRIETLKPIK